MSRSRRSVPFATLTFACAVTLLGQVRTQDVGSFLAGLLGAAEVPKNESLSEQNQVPCPGECVHAFTSILCSKVIEQFHCGASYLRCCVNSDYNFGTVVETSAPLPEESLTETTSEYDLYILTTESNNGVTVKNDATTKTDQDASQTSSVSQALSSTKSTVPPTTRKPRPCPGICVENIFVRYCGGTIPDGICDRGSTCCASNQDYDEPQEISTTAGPSKTVAPAKNTDKGSTYRYPPANEQTTPTTLPGPPCPGPCVAPLFSLLCDAVNDDFYCANDGRCCISNEEFTTAPTTTITTYPQTPFICPGACIPIFLRGMCNRPSEIITQADCEPDFVCCFQPDVKDHLHIETPQIPLLRPGANHPNYRPIPGGPQSGIPPIRQPPVPHPYPQRPHIPIQSNPYPPIINTNVHNQPTNNQVYVGRPGYPAAPSMQPGQGHLQEAPSIIKLTHPQSVNYPGQPYQPQSFAQAKPNTSLELQPIRLTVLAPHNPPVASTEDLENERRRPDLILPQSQYPHHEHDMVHMTAINSNPHHPLQSSVIKPNEHQNQKKQQNTINRFVSTNIAFSPDTMRPITLNKPIKPPTMEKFHPPSPQEFSQPHFPQNSSTVVLVHMNKPKDHTDVVHDLSIIKDKQPSQTVPIHDSFRPLPSQVTFKPTRTSDKVPATPVSVFGMPEATPIPIPENTGDFHAIANVTKVDGTVVDQKKNRPACPGSCIQSFLRFTCFGNSAIYDGFACVEDGTMCCTSVEHIEKYEEHLKTGKPLMLVKPESELKDNENAPDTTRRPGMYVCGIKGNQRRKTGRIVGGKTSAPGEWCWQVALINAKNQYLCGGALIGSRWVLTAAHCITGLVRNGDPIYVRVGDFDLSSPVGSPGAQTQKASTTYIHHNHHGQTLDNDVALLRLENPVKLGDSVCLVCLPARGAESTPGKRCTVTGYGYMSEAGPIALKIRQAELPIVEEQLCTEQINRVTEKRFILPAGSFCAGGESGNDACQGDGGGPLTCENEGYYELTGLVSWGFGCGKQDVPGVYVKVSSYIGWINQIISVNN